MVTLAKILHRNLETIDLDVKSERGFSWHRLALLNDKYDCVTTVRPILALRFPYEKLLTDQKTLADLLLAAIILKMYDLINIVSFKIVITYN